MQAGDGRSCGFTTSNAIYCWGYGGEGQMGNGTETIVSQPVPAANGMPFTSLALGGVPVCGLLAGGKPYCWGRGDFGSLGIGSLPLATMLPTAVINPSP